MTYALTKLIDPGMEYPRTMTSEENTIWLMAVAVSFTIMIVFMCIGILKLNRIVKED